MEMVRIIIKILVFISASAISSTYALNIMKDSFYRPIAQSTSIISAAAAAHSSSAAAAAAAAAASSSKSASIQSSPNFMEYNILNNLNNFHNNYNNNNNNNYNDKIESDRIINHLNNGGGMRQQHETINQHIPSALLKSTTTVHHYRPPSILNSMSAASESNLYAVPSTLDIRLSKQQQQQHNKEHENEHQQNYSTRKIKKQQPRQSLHQYQTEPKNKISMSSELRNGAGGGEAAVYGRPKDSQVFHKKIEFPGNYVDNENYGDSAISLTDYDDDELDGDVKTIRSTVENLNKDLANQLILRNSRNQRRYDVPQIACPPAVDGMERFACPTSDRQGRYRCIDDHVLCNGFTDCPNGEDEDRMACMFYKTTKAHLDILADALLRWTRGR